jgi:hypothetical protein
MASAVREAATLSGVYSNLKTGEVEQAAAELQRWWWWLHWGIRVAAVTAALGIPLMLFVSSAARSNDPAGSLVVWLFLLPFWSGAIIALARPEPALNRMDRFIGWSAMKRDRSRDKGTFTSRWFFRPFYGSLCGSASVTGFITEPYLRTGVMVALQFFAIYVALMVAYVAIAIVIAIVFIMIMIWILTLMLSEGSSGSGSGSRYVARRIARKSEQRTGLLGNKYAQHYDDEGRKAGYTEQRTGLLGNQYQQHYSQEGDKVGYTEDRTGLFGNQYQQHLDQEGSKSGYSEDRQGLFGNHYVQHYSQEGEKDGRSEVRKDLFGKEYVKHEDE